MITLKKFEAKTTFLTTIGEKLWYTSCKDNNLPFIIIRYKKHFSNISWDTATLSFDSYYTLINQAITLRHEILTYCECFRHKKLKFIYTNDFGYLSNVFINDTEKIASMLFDYIYTASHSKDILMTKSSDDHHYSTLNSQ